MKDTYLAGMLIAVLSIFLDYIVLFNLDKIIFKFTEHHYLPAPKLQLVILAINIILFRFLIVKWQRFDTGKGFLLVLLISSGCYMYLNKEII